MRKANAVAAKEIDNTEERQKCAQWGREYKDAPEIFAKAHATVHAVKHAAWLEKQKVVPSVRASVEKQRNSAWKAIAEVTLSAFIRKDGTIFRKMAFIVEHSKKAVDPQRAFILAQIGAADAFGTPPPTVRAVQDALKGTLVCAMTKGGPLKIVTFDELIEICQKRGLFKDETKARNARAALARRFGGGYSASRRTIVRVFEKEGRKPTPGKRGPKGPHKK